MRKDHHGFVLPALMVLLLDLVSKYLILKTIPVHGSVTVVHGFFNLVHVRNRGMAFGFLNRPGSDFQSYFLVSATLCAVVLLVYWFIRLKRHEWRMALGLSFIMGGALGNLIDRLRWGEVVDFLDFHAGSYHWPAFNVADSAITVGTIWLALSILFVRPPNN